MRNKLAMTLCTLCAIGLASSSFAQTTSGTNQAPAPNRPAISPGNTPPPTSNAPRTGDQKKGLERANERRNEEAREHRMEERREHRVEERREHRQEERREHERKRNERHR